jgi:hypothetical protein
MRHKSLFPLALVFILACCTDTTPVRHDLSAKKLYGRWETVYFKVDMETYRGSDSAHTIEVNESNWERVMGLRAIRYYYWRDSTYNILHYNLRDSLVLNISGRYRVEGDSLFMQDLKPERGPQYSYYVNVSRKMMEFTGNEDSDNDGARDDKYYATLRKFDPGY